MSDSADLIKDYYNEMKSAFLKDIDTLPKIEIDASNPRSSIRDLEYECRKVFKSFGRVVTSRDMYEFNDLRRKVLEALETSMAFKAFTVAIREEAFVKYFPYLAQYRADFERENYSVFDGALRHYPVLHNNVAGIIGGYNLETLVEVILELTSQNASSEEPELSMKVATTPAEIDDKVTVLLANFWKGLTSKGLQLFVDAMEDFDKKHPKYKAREAHEEGWGVPFLGYEEEAQEQILDELKSAPSDFKLQFIVFRSKIWPQIAKDKHMRIEPLIFRPQDAAEVKVKQLIKQAGCEDDFWPAKSEPDSGLHEFPADIMNDKDERERIERLIKELGLKLK